MLVDYEKDFVEICNDEFMLTKDYTDFSGTKSTRKKKLNKKYFVYQDNGNQRVTTSRPPISVITVVTWKKKRIIFFSDTNQQVSFMIVRAIKGLPAINFVRKIERSPASRNFVFVSFFALFLFGIARFNIYDFCGVELSLGRKKAIRKEVCFLFPKKVRNRFKKRPEKIFLLLHIYFLRIPLKEIYNYYVKTSDVNIPIYWTIPTRNETLYFNYNRTKSSKFKKANYVFCTKSARIKKDNIEMFVRLSLTGQFVVVVTSILDRRVYLKGFLAKVFSLFSKNKEKYNVYIEKFGQGASESAFELFKYAVKQDENSKYILDESHDDFETLKKKYPKNVYAKNSIMSFYVILLANSLISSEVVGHFQRRLYDNDSLFRKKVISCNKKIFLQHGVALATDLFERGYFNKKSPTASDYIIVNSNFEKTLFMKRAKYKQDQLLLTGLPNIDLFVNSRGQDKDTIVFLLTWRPWDLVGDFSDNSLLARYMSFVSIVKNDPFYSDKNVKIILHPKAKTVLLEQFPNVYKQLEEFLYTGNIRDIILKTDTIISDYSSITFLAFAAGAKVVFYWEDKKSCERRYGAPNILQAEHAFGDIVYDFDQLNLSVINGFGKLQKQEHLEKFNLLVECTDGNNTTAAFDVIYNKILKS